MERPATESISAQTGASAAVVAGLRLPSWFMAVLLVVAAVVAYQPAWYAGFIWDDDVYVTHNRLLTAPDGLKRIWFSQDSPSQYFPLTYTVFRLERGLWGLDSSGYHWVNILLHAANAVLLWGLLRRLRLPAAWLAAALFALHPVQVESVAWITELKSVLSLLFCLLAAWACLRFADKWRVASGQWPVFYGLSLLFFALALFAKTTACTWPVALLLILWVQGKPMSLRRVGEIVPFVAMGLVMGLLSIWWEQNHQGAVGEDFAMGWMSRVLLASRAVWFYLGKLVWPVGLSFSYARWHIDPADPRQYLWPAACVIAGVAIWKSGRGLRTAAIYYMAMLAPLLGFIPEYTFRYAFVADHYQYAASIGPLALAAAGIDKLLGRFGRAKHGMYAGLLVILGAMTWCQCRMYADAETLWQTTLRQNPESWLACNNLGVVLGGEGRIDDAIRQYREAIRLKPDCADAHSNLGAALRRKGQFEEAIRQCREAIHFAPDYAPAHYNLGLVLGEKRQIEEAIREYREAIRLIPKYAAAHYKLGMALEGKGQIDEAIRQYQDAIRLAPDNADAHNSLGTALGGKGQIDEAIRELRETIRLKPDSADARNNLGTALGAKGRIDEAIEQYQEAVRLKPDSADMRNNLGSALAMKGQLEEAIRQFQEAIRLKPNFAEARKNLADALKMKSLKPK